MTRISIDPVTRVNGQLRIDAELTGGAVAEAWSSGTMFRGLESGLHGRDPRDAWLLAQRICGSCTGVHALASVRAVEHALGVTIPTNARLIRNLLAATGMVRSHVLGFYQAELPDWVDARSAMSGDLATTARLAQAASNRPQSTAAALGQARDRLAAVIDSTRQGPYGGWWGHPAYRLAPEQDLLLLAHSIEALDWQRRLARVQALLGGKDPHPQTFLVGGMALAAPWGGATGPRNRQHPDVPQRNSPDPLGPAGLDLMAGLLTEARTFIDQVFLPDVRLLAAAYKDWTSIGAGPGAYLAYGEFPQDDTTEPVRFLPRGRIALGSLQSALDVDEQKITEAVAHSWYAADGDPATLRHPTEGTTAPAFDGTALPLTGLDVLGRYTWLKAPRYDGEPAETGPLARVLVAAADGRADVTSALGELLTGLGMGPEALPGVIGRMLARAVEARVLVTSAIGWLEELRQNLSTGDLAVADASWWDPETWPADAAGFSLGEGPRGAVGHWLTIHDKAIDRYQVVDASTWNASPRDGSGIRGPIESALQGTTVSDPARPLEVLRVVHSFSPCAACSTHLFGPASGRPIELRVRRGEEAR